MRKRLGISAYKTIVKEWNPKVAAQRLLRFSEGLVNGKVNPEEKGPLSIAPVIAPWEGYRYVRRKE